MYQNNAHLLLVDDDERILSLLGTYLSKNKFLVSSARNSTEARYLLNYFEFDLLILDVMMPGENGLELLKVLESRRMFLPFFSQQRESQETEFQDWK